MSIAITEYGVKIADVGKFAESNSAILFSRILAILFSRVFNEFFSEKCIVEFKVLGIYRVGENKTIPLTEFMERLTKYLDKIGAEEIETKICREYGDDYGCVKCSLSKEVTSLLLYPIYLDYTLRRHHFNIIGIYVREKIEKEEGFFILEYSNDLVRKHTREGKLDILKSGRMLADISNNIIFGDSDLIGGTFFISDEKIREKFIKKLDEFAKGLHIDLIDLLRIKINH